MKKLWGEEKIVLRHVLPSAILVSVLILPVRAQIPINGFCKYNSYETLPGFSSFAPVTFNDDPYTDLALFNSGENKLVVLPGNVNANFGPPVQSTLKKEVSALQMISLPNESNNYVFVSRKKRTVGLLTFSKSGSAQVKSEISFNSFPENIHLGDIDQDNTNEILVYGSSFNGLAILNIRNNKFEVTNIFSGRIFPRAFFIDLNNDSYPDIAAIDLLDNSLKFFFNNTRGKFSEVRSFHLNGNIFAIQSYDFNLDGYQDIIYASRNTINIVFGDSVSSYMRYLKVPTRLITDRFLISDFNRDGFNDIAYLNKNQSKVSILYAKDDKGFYPELLYLSKENISEIVPYYSKFINGILALSTGGKFYIIHNFNVIQDNIRISIGGEPSTITYFDAGNDRIYDFCYYDRQDQTLKLLTRNTDGIPSKLYNYQLLQDIDQIVIDDKLKDQKAFYCYHKNKRLIEIILLDLKNNKVKKEKIYTSGPIADLKIQQDGSGERARIYVLTNRSGNLGLLVYHYKDFRYTTASSPVFAQNAVKAHLALGSQVTVYSWENSNNQYILNKRIINSELLPEITEYKYAYKSTDRPRIGGFTGDLFNNDNMNMVSFIFDKKRSMIVATTGTGSFKVNSKSSDLSRITDSYMYFGEYRFNGLNRLFLYYPEISSIKRVEFIANRKVIFTTNVIDSVNVNSYFIKNLNFKKYHLVYSDSKEHCITIREII